jgi:hypothetical protein
MYQGHLADGSSVLRHSAGAHYPFIVVTVGDSPSVMHPDGTIEKVATFTVNDRADRTACYGYAIQRAMELAEARRVAL